MDNLGYLALKCHFFSPIHKYVLLISGIYKFVASAKHYRSPIQLEWIKCIIAVPIVRMRFLEDKAKGKFGLPNGLN